MTKKRWLMKSVAVLTAASFVGAACGDDDDATSTTAAAATTAAPDTTAAAATTAGAATTAAATTAAAAQYGQDATNKNLYKGPEGFQLDLSKCPADYNPTQGISATEIKIFESLPQSGPLAGFGLIGDGARSYFNLINEQGGIGGRKIVLDFKDDAYTAERTVNNVNEAIGGKQYAVMMTLVGTPNNLAVWDITHKECMPQLLNGTGAAQWGDVENHPWTTGMQIDYFTEAALWVEWMKKEFPNGAKVAALTFNNDFGKSYDKGLKANIKDTKLELVADEFHDPTAPNVTNQITTMLSKSPDVVVIQTSGTFCTQAMAELEKAGFYAKGKVMMSATCASISQFFKPLADQGLTGNGTYLVQYLKDVNDPEFANDEFVKLFHATLAKQGLDSKQSTYATGWIFAWFMVEILKIADKLPGGLTRPNLVVANRMIDVQHPLALEGIRCILKGMKDAYTFEAGRIAQYGGGDGSAKTTGTYKAVSDVLSVEGQLGTYKTVADIQI